MQATKINYDIEGTAMIQEEICHMDIWDWGIVCCIQLSHTQSRPIGINTLKLIKNIDFSGSIIWMYLRCNNIIFIIINRASKVSAIILFCILEHQNRKKQPLCLGILLQTFPLKMWLVWERCSCLAKNNKRKKKKMVPAKWDLLYIQWRERIWAMKRIFAWVTSC